MTTVAQHSGGMAQMLCNLLNMMMSMFDKQSISFVLDRELFLHRPESVYSICGMSVCLHGTFVEHRASDNHY